MALLRVPNPKALPPAPRGRVTHIVVHELGGRVEASLTPAGAHYEIEVPLARVADSKA
jgi:hypothetical protein